MSAELIWDITHETFEEHKEELEALYRKINVRIIERFERNDIPTRITCGPNASQTSKEMLLATSNMSDRISSRYDIFVFLGG